MFICAHPKLTKMSIAACLKEIFLKEYFKMMYKNVYAVVPDWLVKFQHAACKA